MAQAYDVPVVLITGDRTTADETRPFCPGIEAVVVKESVSRLAASSLHPQVACERIRAAARRALDWLQTFQPPTIDLPVTLQVRYRNADLAEMATWLRGVESIDATTVGTRDDDPLRLYWRFVTAVVLTRGIAE